jgi:hypothetical protein
MHRRTHLTPWGSHFEQNLEVTLHHKIHERVAHKLDDMADLVLLCLGRNRLRFHHGLHLLGLHVGNKGVKIGRRDGTIRGKSIFLLLSRRPSHVDIERTLEWTETKTKDKDNDNDNDNDNFRIFTIQKIDHFSSLKKHN